jgi:hypothetical protein
MPFDIATLTPDERAEALRQLQEEPCDPIEELANALDILVTKVEQLEGTLMVLKKTVDDDLIGGIRGLYDENVRASSITDLKGKYGSLFDPYAKGLEGVGIPDIYGALHDVLSKLKEGSDYNDEMGDSKIKEIANSIAGTLKPDAVEVETAEVKPAEEPKAEPEEEDPQAAIKRAVERMKKRENK